MPIHTVQTFICLSHFREGHGDLHRKMTIGLWQGQHDDKMGWLVPCPSGDTGSILPLWAPLQEDTWRAVLSAPEETEDDDMQST